MHIHASLITQSFMSQKFLPQIRKFLAQFGSNILQDTLRSRNIVSKYF